MLAIPNSSTVYPQFSSMARDFLDVSGTGVPVERMFSNGADVCSPKRLSISASAIQEAMCLRDWLSQKDDKEKVYQG